MSNIVTPEEFLEPPREEIMNRDPIVEEIHRTRQKILDECKSDLDQMLDRLKAAEVQDRRRVVTTTSLDPEKREPDFKRRLQ